MSHGYELLFPFAENKREFLGENDFWLCDSPFPTGDHCLLNSHGNSQSDSQHRFTLCCFCQPLQRATQMKPFKCWVKGVLPILGFPSWKALVHLYTSCLAGSCLILSCPCFSKINGGWAWCYTPLIPASWRQGRQVFVIPWPPRST